MGRSEVAPLTPSRPADRGEVLARRSQARRLSRCASLGCTGAPRSACNRLATHARARGLWMRYCSGARPRSARTAPLEGAWAAPQVHTGAHPSLPAPPVAVALGRVDARRDRLLRARRRRQERVRRSAWTHRHARGRAGAAHRVDVVAEVLAIPPARVDHMQRTIARHAHCMHYFVPEMGEGAAGRARGHIERRACAARPTPSTWRSTAHGRSRAARIPPMRRCACRDRCRRAGRRRQRADRRSIEWIDDSIAVSLVAGQQQALMDQRNVYLAGQQLSTGTCKNLIT